MRLIINPAVAMLWFFLLLFVLIETSLEMVNGVPEARKVLKIPKTDRAMV